MAAVHAHRDIDELAGYGRNRRGIIFRIDINTLLALGPRPHGKARRIRENRQIPRPSTDCAQSITASSRDSRQARAWVRSTGSASCAQKEDRAGTLSDELSRVQATNLATSSIANCPISGLLRWEQQLEGV